MKPTAIVCGTTMLICYAILGTVYEVTWYLAPLIVFGSLTLGMGLGDGKAK